MKLASKKNTVIEGHSLDGGSKWCRPSLRWHMFSIKTFATNFSPSILPVNQLKSPIDQALFLGPFLGPYAPANLPTTRCGRYAEVRARASAVERMILQTGGKQQKLRKSMGHLWKSMVSFPKRFHNMFPYDSMIYFFMVGFSTSLR